MIFDQRQHGQCLTVNATRHLSASRRVRLELYRHSRIPVRGKMFEAEPKRQRSSATLAESAGRKLVAELNLQQQLADWHAQLARYRAVAMSGRRQEHDLSKLVLEMRNTRRRMITEMQARGQGIGKSGSVTSLLRSLDRAIEDARSLL